MNFYMLTTTSVLLAMSVSMTEAFTVVPPVAVQLVATPQQVAPVSPLSNLPSQRELMAQSASSSSTLSLSTAAAPTAVAAKPAKSTNVAAAGSGVIISDINFDGKVPTSEADEYVVVTNGSKAPVDISKYYIYVATTGTQGPTFFFPKDTYLKPGASVRIYTNEVHKETGGYSFGSGKAIWNNRGGLAVMRDNNGQKLFEYKYKPSSSA